MLRRDLRAAGIEYAIDMPEGKGYLDFHALRHTFRQHTLQSQVWV